MKNFKIIVPIDFSKTSFSAYRYAVHFSKLVNAEITLIHILTGSFNTNEPIVFDSIQSISDAALSRLRYFAIDYPKEEGEDIPNTTLKYEVRFGIPGFTVADFAKDNGFDLIIMGTRKKHDFMDRVLGTTSSIVLKTSKIPTILIHQSTNYEPIKNITFAFDATTDLGDAIKKFDTINGHIKANTNFVHVNKKGEDLTNPKKTIIELLVENHQAAYTFSIKTLENEDIRAGITQFFISEKANLLVLVSRNKAIFKSIFKKSISKHLAQSLILPVLIIPE